MSKLLSPLGLLSMGTRSWLIFRQAEGQAPPAALRCKAPAIEGPMGDLSKAIPIAARPKAASSAGPGDHLKTTPAQTTAMTAAVESINEWFGGVVATPFPMETPPPPPRRNPGSANAKPKEEVSDTATAGSTHGEGVEVPLSTRDDDATSHFKSSKLLKVMCVLLRYQKGLLPVHMVLVVMLCYQKIVMDVHMVKEMQPLWR